MNEIEGAAKRLVKCDNATFYCYDKSSNKFFSQGDYRNWQGNQNVDELNKAFKCGEIISDDKEAIIPLVSANGNSLGVIVAEKESGFTKEDYDHFCHGGQVANTFELALIKEYEHQGRITDALTQIKNRQGLDEYLSNTLVGNINSGKSVNILMCDIDHFKNVNDTYGHDVGDIILESVAASLREFTRTGADCAFRLGGEEMVCVFFCPPEEAAETAENIRKNIENKVHSIIHNDEPVDVKVTVSMGLHNMEPTVEITPENVKSIFADDLRITDMAMYEAKHTGRNKLIIADEKVHLSYLALKSAELLCGDDRSNIDEVKQETVKMLVEDKDIDTVVEALQAYAEENPELAEMAAELVSKINETANLIEEKQTEEIDMSYESRAPKYYNKEAFKEIENKTYLNTDAATAFQIAQRATAANIEFSAKYDGAKSAVTVDGVKDRAFVEAMRAEFNIPETTSQEKQSKQPKREKKVTYFNREGFKDIQNKTYIRTDSKTAYSISKEAAKQGIEHSAKYAGEKSAVTLDGVKNKDFIETVKNMAEWADKVQVREAQNQNKSRNTEAR